MTFITGSASRWNKRRDDMVLECRNTKDRKKVSGEIRQIMETNWDKNRNDMANALLNFLEDKYDTKRWIVTVQSIKRKTSTTIDFFKATINNTAAYAINTDGPIKFSSIASSYLNEFKFPYCDSNLQMSCYPIEPYLIKYLTPLTGKQLAYATLVSEEPDCKLLLEQNKESVPIVASSNGLECYQLNGNYLQNNSRCIDIKILVVPIKNTTNPENCSLQRGNYSEQSGRLLRHDYIQGYLSVVSSSEEEGASVILDREWRNSSGQIWKFVDSQLRNNQGKCLTAWSKKSWYLYQYECHPDWTGQNWTRRGLQIVNGYSFCLAFVGTKDDPVMYVIQDVCDATPPFLWYDWNYQVMTNRSSDYTFPSYRHLRNEYSKQYLNGHGIDGKRISRYPWINRAGQNWQLIDGLLKNANGMCLVGKSWDAVESDCAAAATKANGLWRYNEKQQLVSAEGYCLSVANGKNFLIHYISCNDDPEQRWYFE